MSDKFIVFTGKFICHKCKIDVLSARLWYETKDLTWMCDKKHISKVNMLPKTKKDYENE